MREAQEIEGIRFPETLGCSVAGGEPSKLDQPGLVGVQLQAELREPLTEIAEELLGVAKILEPNDEVIGEPHHDYVASGTSTPPLMGPLVECVMKVDVGEQRRRHASYNVAKRPDRENRG